MLKKIFLAFLILIVLAGGYFLNIMYSTGFFRDIENVDLPESRRILLPGAEDITIDYASGTMFISSFDRAAAVGGENPTGGIYIMDLNSDELIPVRLDDGLGEGFHPHGISLLKIDSTTYRLWVVNHQKGKHTIELFEFIGEDHLAHLRTYSDPLIISPNDVVGISTDQFYFTNDHGKTEGLGLLAENYLGLPYSGVVYFDGESFTKAADGISYANGINKSPNGKQILVASPRKFKLLVYDIQQQGDLKLVNSVDVGTGIDNIEWDDNGLLWMGAHPNLLRFSAYAKLKKPSAPSEVITWDPETNEVKQQYLNDGSAVSSSSVAVPYNGMLFIGTVRDDKVLVLKMN